MIREEWSRLFSFEERHRRLVARLLITSGLSIAAFILGTVLVWVFERGQPGGDIHGLGDAAFFTAMQLMTISSYMKDPLTPVGRVINVGVGLWAIFVVTAVAGSFSTFFNSGDSG